MNKRLLIGIGVAAILVILAALLGEYIGYDVGFERAVEKVSLDKNNQDWKLYKNDKYGFEFKYPPDYKVDELEQKEEGGKSRFYIVVNTPDTERVKQETLGELTDQIFIEPRATTANISEELLFSDPIEPNEGYFSRQGSASDSLNSYLGKIKLGNRNGFRLKHSELGEKYYILVDNGNDTWFVVRHYSLLDTEPYRSILDSLQFNLQ